MATFKNAEAGQKFMSTNGMEHTIVSNSPEGIMVTKFLPIWEDKWQTAEYDVLNGPLGDLTVELY